ncbi:MAG: tRNA-dihydrouridine synthase, partial [Gammaproteobacteria bacterium]
PPLRYEMAAQLKRDFPALGIVANGGIQTLAAMQQHLTAFDGVMIGREALANPYLFADVDRRFFDAGAPVRSREQLLQDWLPHVQAELARGVPLARMLRHALGLFQGCPGARRWRRQLSEAGARPGAGVEVLHTALSLQAAA